MTDTPRYMSQAKYAVHRGVKPSTVSQYKTEGKLMMTADGLVDVVQSDKLLAVLMDSRGGDRTSTPTKAAPESKRMQELKVEGEELKVARQRIAVDRAAGLLVEKRVVLDTAFTLARDAQEAMLSIPDRLSSLVAAESDPGIVYDLLSKELRDVCNELGENAAKLFENVGEGAE